MIEKVETFFSGLSEIGSGLPDLVLVSLTMILAAAGTAVIAGILLGLIRLIFGQKAIDFIKSIPQRLTNTTNTNVSYSNASNGVNDSQNLQ